VPGVLKETDFWTFQCRPLFQIDQCPLCRNSDAPKTG